MQNNQFYSLLIFFIISIILHCIQIFSKSYIQKKGENLATKEDINDITKIVEDIKHQNSSTLALLNANLSLATKGIENFEAEAFKAYFNYHQTITSIIHVIADIDFTKIKYEYIHILQKQQDDIYENYQKIWVARSKIDLFNDNDEIREIVFNMHGAILKFMGQLSQSLIGIEHGVKNTFENKKEITNYFVQNNKNEQLLNQLKSYQKDFESLLSESLEEYKTFRIGGEYANCVGLLTQFEVLIKQYFKEEKRKILNGDS